MNTVYTHKYFSEFADSSRRSAQIVVSRMMQLVAPTSVIDFGCGVGGWLAEFRAAGVRDILGIDGEWVPAERLAIPADALVHHDLAAAPYAAPRSFDLSMSVEAAEHLPPEAARPLVQAMTDAAPVVLFSAAILHQPGENHLNPQWPAYWAALFAERGYTVIDALRFEIWEDERVDWWYRQNIMMYVRSDQLHRWPALEALHRATSRPPLPVIHPEMFDELLKWGLRLQKLTWELYAKLDATKP